jgi:hypothetical protein
MSNNISLLSFATDQNIDTFDAFWRNNAPWFEAPNIRRGGWSGVVKCVVDSFGKPETVFIKRQENHVTKTLMHPIKGIPTFLREYLNIQSLNAKNIPTLDVLYFEIKASKAVLVTKALEGYVSLDKIDLLTLHPRDRNALLTSIAKVIRQLHQYHYQHNCLYPKHIMVRQLANEWDVKLIDLEKLKYRFFKKHAVIHDLTTFIRHLNGLWSDRDIVVFFQAYFDQPKILLSSKKTIHLMCKKIHRKAQAKHHIQSIFTS